MTPKEFFVFLAYLEGGFIGAVLLSHYLWGWGDYPATFAGLFGAFIGATIYGVAQELQSRRKK